jgi:hypothetical protein
VTLTDNVIGHVRDVGAGYFSLWNWHRIRADRLKGYYEKFPDAINSSRVRSAIACGRRGVDLRRGRRFRCDPGDGQRRNLRSSGVLRIGILDAAGHELATGGLDAGYPLPGKVRQAKFPLPKGTDWKGCA